MVTQTMAAKLYHDCNADVFKIFDLTKMITFKQIDQNWENGTTTWVFNDNSVLQICGMDAEVLKGGEQC